MQLVGTWIEEEANAAQWKIWTAYGKVAAATVVVNRLSHLNANTRPGDFDDEERAALWRAYQHAGGHRAQCYEEWMNA